MPSTSRTVRIFGRFVHWRRGVTNIILWIYVYGSPLSSRLHVFCLRRVGMLFSSFFFSLLSGPLSPPPSLFSICYIFVEIVSMLSFCLIVTTNPCLQHSFEQFLLLSPSLSPTTVISPLFVMFSGSCYVASSLVHSTPNRESRWFWRQNVPPF
jgi:hypothetical protein